MSEQGPPAPLTARALTVATFAALVIALLALAVYILPAGYGVDPVGAGKALGIAPDADPSSQSPEAPSLTLPDASIHTYEIAWSTTTLAGPEAEGYTAEGETTTVGLALARPNLTRASLTLAWSDDNETAGQQTEPDELELVLEAPDGRQTEPVRAQNGPDGQGTLSTALAVRGIPGNRTIHAFGEAQAQDHPATNVSHGPSDGPWLAHVTVVEAGDADGGLGMPEGSPGSDEGTDWQLTSSAASYAPSIEDLGPADLREDEHTFEVPPGEGMEHKVSLEAGEPLVYAWAATGEVYTDFHGEQANASGFTSYGSGDEERSAGTFTAPLTGTHGWYWENQRDRPVAIRLLTRGDYDDGFTT